MPGQRGRSKVRIELREYPEGGEGMEVKGRLGVDRVIQVSFRSLPHDGGKWKAEDFVSLGEGAFCDGIGEGKLAPHANGLRALAGEYECSSGGKEFHFFLPERSEAKSKGQ